MSTSNNSNNNLQDMLSKTMADLSSTSLKMVQPMLKNMMDMYTQAGQSVLKGDYSSLQLPKLGKETCHCCPPDCHCPPHCIAAIERRAMRGERIIVPFTVKNTCSKQKSYQIGVRELKDQNGGLAPSQPKLNRYTLTLDPGQSIRVLMLVDLASFTNGSTYQTEIVLREKQYNQNVCFTLFVEDGDSVLVQPQDEKEMNMRWQSWQDHYWCEKKSKPGVTVNPNTTAEQPTLTLIK
jgi:hypothetical protein